MKKQKNIKKRQAGRSLKSILMIMLAFIFAMQSLPLISAQAAQSDVFKIVNLKTEQAVDPIGIDEERPQFSWQMESEAKSQVQKKYQIIVRDNGGKVVWNSGEVTSGISVNILYDGSDLTPKTGYTWTVTVWNQDDVRVTSDTASFETGFMSTSDTDWEAKWIGLSSAGSSSSYSFEISLDQGIISQSAGLLFKTSSDEEYMWQITADGSSAQFKPHLNLSLTGQSDLTSRGILTREKAVAGYNMTVRYQDNTLKTYIDGIEADSRPMSFDSLLSVGFRQWYGEDAWFENIVVKENGAVIYDSNSSESLTDDFPGLKISGKRLQGGLSSGDCTTRKVLNEPADAGYRMEFDLKLISYNSGFIFSAVDDKNFYMWQLSVDDAGGKKRIRMRPHTWKNGNASCVAEKDVTTMMAPYLFGEAVPNSDAALLDSYNHYRLDIKGGVVKTYIRRVNEPDSAYVLIDTFNFNESIPYGKTGFRHNTVGNGNYERAAYMNLKAYDISDPQSPELLLSDSFDSVINPYGGGRIENNQLIFDADESLIVIREDAAEEDGAIHFRKDFKVNNKTVESARLYITARGGYVPYINGQRVGKDYLNPGNTDFNYRTYYKTYDVTDFISKGRTNAVGIIVGKAWFASQNRSIEEETAKGGQYVYPVYGSDKAVLAQLEITYNDGGDKTVVCTDTSWLATDQGPFISDDNWDGETYDARKELGNWSEAGFVTDDRWESAKEAVRYYGELNAQKADSVREYKTISPIKMTEPTPGTYIYNLGQNMAGVTRITATAPAGTVMRIRHGEMLYKDGTLMTSNLGANAKATDYYTFKGDPNGETYQPTFTYHGFQYIEITGLDTPPEIENVKGVVLCTLDEEHRTGTFDTSNSLINKLYQNTMWSQTSNSISIPSDCPQRSERYGWLGDAQVFTRTATYNFDVEQFYRKYTQDMRDGQRDNGSYLDLSPNPMGAFYDNNIGWADAGIIIPWHLFQQYGETVVLEENYTAMKKYIDFLLKSYPESSGFNRPKGLWGDWMGPDQPDEAYIGLTFYAYSARLFANICEVLQKEDAAYYISVADKIQQKWRDTYLTSDGAISYGSTGKNGMIKGAQTAYAEAIYFGLIPDEYLHQAGQYLVQAIEANGGLLATGFLGTSYIAPALSMSGNSEAAYKLLLQEDAPSWLFPVLNGATTIWEQWTSFIMDGYQLSNDSFNHYSLGAVVEWMYRYSAGIDRDETSPGFKHFILQPSPSSQFEQDGKAYVKASYRTPYGLIKSEWELQQSGTVCEYNATVPANTTATLKLPTSQYELVTESGAPVSGNSNIKYIGTKQGISTYELGSGSYSFSFPMDSSVKLNIENPQNIASKVTVDGISYTLPCQIDIWNYTKEITVESADENYEFSHFTGDLAGSVNPIPNNAAEDMTIAANFKYVPVSSGTHKLSISDTTGSSVIINGKTHTLPYTGSYENGAELTLQFIPAAGYLYSGVTGDFTGNGQIGTVKMTGDLSIEPIFTDRTAVTNIALNQKVFASSNNTNDAYGWANYRLTDGVTTGTGYTSNSYSDPDVSDAPVWIEVDLGRDRLADKVVLYPRTDKTGNEPRAIPEDFTIQVRADGSDEYTVVKSVTGQANTSSEPITLNLDKAVPARYVRLSATKLGAVEGSYHMQFAEMEIYNAADEPLVSDISLTADKAEIAIGETLSVTAKAGPAEALNKSVEWYIHDLENGMYTTLSDKAYAKVMGETVILTGLKEGEITLVARAADGSGTVGTYNIEIQGSILAADKTALNAAIAEANSLRITDKYANADSDLKASFDAALRDANSVYADPLATEQAVSEALSRLNEEIGKLNDAGDTYKKGDVDANGVINVSDMITLKNLIMSSSWTSEQLARGDMNDDGNLTVADMLSIKNLIMAG